jgi:tRNA dimethylallyltransferase
MAKPLLVICGPTATGKTSLGIRLAKKFNGEILSADSRQVYKGMDIGTSKDLEIIRQSKIPVHLLDVVKPDQEFNVAKYYQLAWKAIKEIWRKKKLPIIVGGTGFYIKAVIDGIESLGIEPDQELRKELGKLEIKKLRDKLKRLDPRKWERMNQSDRQNPRRLIRAIEILLANKRPSNIQHPTFDILIIGLVASNQVLYQRIDGRVKARVKQGAEDEIKRLLGRGYTWENSALGVTIGYQEWQVFLERKSTKREAVKRWQFAEHAYARRQLTWLRKDKRIKWFDILKPNFKTKVEKLIKDWYTKTDAAKS